MRYLFLIPLWLRPRISRLCLENLLELSKDNNILIHCIVSDPDNKALCDELGISYIEYENEPVGAKLNEGLWSCKDMKWDALVTIGSDDLISPKLFDFYKQYDEDILQLDKCFFINSKDGSSKIFKGYLGGGRLIKRHVIESLHYVLWDSTLNRGLDTSAMKRMEVYGYKVEIKEVPFPYIFDIKSNVNIWGYSKFLGNRSNIERAYEQLLPVTAAKLKLLIEGVAKDTPVKVNEVKDNYEVIINMDVVGYFIKESGEYKFSTKGFKFDLYNYEMMDEITTKLFEINSKKK